MFRHIKNMGFSGFRTFLSILTIISMVMAGVSPACAFISGKNADSGSYIEVCSGLGMKRIALEPASDDSSPKDPSGADHKNLKESCAFCFAQTHIGADLNVPPALTGPSLVAAAQTVLEDGFLPSFDRSLPPARGPPAFFS